MNLYVIDDIRSALFQLAICFGTAPSHYLNHGCCSKVPWHSLESNFKDFRCVSYQSLKWFEYFFLLSKISFISLKVSENVQSESYIYIYVLFWYNRNFLWLTGHLSPDIFIRGYFTDDYHNWNATEITNVCILYKLRLYCIGVLGIIRMMNSLQLIVFE